MRFTVDFADGIWSFTVESEDDYREEFELTDLSEARDTAWDLIEEIAKESDDFPEEMLRELRNDV